MEMDNIEDPLTPAPTPAITRSSRPAQSTRVGTGKGGKRFSIVRHQLKKAKYTSEEKKIQKDKWKQFLKMVETESTNLLEADLTASHLTCPDCTKHITRGNFIRHRQGFK